MSDYSKITNFLSKDSLALNDPAKYVKGSEIDAEYNAIAVAIATKADTASPTLVTPNIGAATGTSLALGGGTALTTTNRTGTGNLVLATAPTLTGLTVSGGNFVSRGISDTATAVALSLSGSGANSITIANSATNPTIGTSAGALLLAPATGFVQLNGATTSGLLLNAATGNSALVAMYVNGTEVARIIAGAAENLLLGTSSTGTTQVSVTHTASANRYITLTGSNGGNPTIGTSAGNLLITPAGIAAAIFTVGASTGNYVNIAGVASGGQPSISVIGVDSDISFALSAKGTGGNISLNAASAAQVVILPTASANRYLTLTGSNGGNPTIGTSAGSLAITPPVIGAGYLQAVAATATPAGGTAGAGVFMGSIGIGIYFGSGAPTVSAAKGSLYLRSDGTTTNNRMYVNTDGGTTWTAVTTAA